MISKIAPIAAFVSLLLVNCCSNEKTQRQEDSSANGAPARNMDVYDKAGPFVIIVSAIDHWRGLGLIQPKIDFDCNECRDRT